MGGESPRAPLVAATGEIGGRAGDALQHHLGLLDSWFDGGFVSRPIRIA